MPDISHPPRKTTGDVQQSVGAGAGQSAGGGSMHQLSIGPATGTVAVLEAGTGPAAVPVLEQIAGEQIAGERAVRTR